MTVREFLTQNGLSAYADAFEAQCVELADLSAMTDDELKSEFGITVFGDRKRFKAAVAGLTGAPAPSLSGPTRMAPTPTPTPTPSLSGPTRMDAPSAFPERLGNYRILGLVGSGGMGTVVRARHTEEGWARQQGGDVAIKLIHPHIATDPAFRSRFMSEAAMGRKVQHRGFLTTWDVLSEGAWLGTVMSLVVGESLTNKVVPGGLPVADVIRLLTPIAEALDYLHGLGIVHRDLKPANIVVRPDAQPVVLDLGIAKDAAALENHTRTMTTMGTSAWMAPEQADAKNVDGAVDRYAFGMIAYALLSGRLPWDEGTSEVGVLVSKLTGQLVPLAQVRAGLPGHVVDAVMKMVSVDAGMRYATCAAFVGALKDDGGAARVAAKAKAEAEATAVLQAKQEAEAAAVLKAKQEAEAAAVLKAQDAPPSQPAPKKADFSLMAVGTVLGLGFLGCKGVVVFRQVDSQLTESDSLTPAAVSSPKVGVDFRRTTIFAGFKYQSPTLGTMKWIPPGTFMMGSPETEAGRSPDETQHSVTLTKGYYLMEHEVTQGEWQAVMGSNPSSFTACGPTCPVEQVSWNDAVAFARQASARDGVTYALPTEAQWEFAVRGSQQSGQETLYAGSNEATSVGWILDNSGSTTHAVCGLARNAYGLCDMTGNVWEWTSDWYGDYGGNATDPTGASTGSYRVVRGGSWDGAACYGRFAIRSGYDPADAYGHIGFRLSMTGT